MGQVEIHFFNSVDVQPNTSPEETEKSKLPVDPKVDSVIDRFGNWLARSYFSPSTKRAYNSRFRQFERFVEVERASKQTLPDFPEMAKEFLSLASAENSLKQGSINCFISLFEKMAKISGLENVGFQRYAVTDSEKVILSRAQQKLYLIAAEKSQSCRDMLLVLIFLRTNIRLGEAANLKMQDLFWEENRLKIRVNGRSGVREEIMNSRIEQHMKDWLSERAKSHVFVESQYLFPGAGGRRITTSAMDAVLRKIGWKARLTVSARLLRNTYLHRLEQEQRLFMNMPDQTLGRGFRCGSKSFVASIAE